MRQVEKLEGNMAKLTIEVSAEDFEAAVEKAYQKSKNKTYFFLTMIMIFLFKRSYLIDSS